MERWLSAPAHRDPLYLSNRTFGQKATVWVVLGTVGIALLVLLYLGEMGYFASAPPPKALELTPAEEATRMLPNISAARLPSDPDVEALDAHIVHGPVTMLEGMARNRTSRSVLGAEITFQLTDAAGSQLGAVVARVGAMEPMETARFRIPVRQSNAAFALVREIHTR